MNKLRVLIASIFVVPALAVVGKLTMDAITTNYTFTGLISNLSVIPWLVPYARSWWWLGVIAIIVLLVLFLMKKEEPTPPQFPMFNQPARTSKVKKQQIPPRPPIFLGR